MENQLRYNREKIEFNFREQSILKTPRDKFNAKDRAEGQFVERVL
ncbi:hypothetical protein [Clostridium botulinum]|nr:hypothetical protein [Clostridium botulinum]